MDAFGTRAPPLPCLFPWEEYIAYDQHRTQECNTFFSCLNVLFLLISLRELKDGGEERSRLVLKLSMCGSFPFLEPWLVCV